MPGKGQYMSAVQNMKQEPADTNTHFSNNQHNCLLTLSPYTHQLPSILIPQPGSSIPQHSDVDRQTKTNLHFTTFAEMC